MRFCSSRRRIYSITPHLGSQQGETMKLMDLIMMGGLALAAAAAIAQTEGKPPQTQPSTILKTVHAVIPDRGQEVFNQNCSRCHNAPEGFSANISGTIAKHMRVRASLSDADYKALLRFLNP
jgi:mono/diheme cytochrome c family protein